jgi:hypothetical protein
MKPQQGVECGSWVSCINYAVLGWPLLLLPSFYPVFIATHAALMLITWLIVLFVAPVGSVQRLA